MWASDAPSQHSRLVLSANWEALGGTGAGWQGYLCLAIPTCAGFNADLPARLRA